MTKILFASPAVTFKQSFSFYSEKTTRYVYVVGNLFNSYKRCAMEGLVLTNGHHERNELTRRKNASEAHGNEGADYAVCRVPSPREDFNAHNKIIIFEQLLNFHAPNSQLEHHRNLFTSR